MGYTHYWRNEGVTQARWGVAIDEACRVVAFRRHDLAGWDAHGQPAIGDGITFNGKGGNGHETFAVPATAIDLPAFSFCKTAHKPYDLVVCAVLATLRHHAGPAFKVASDGTPAEWHSGIALAREATGQPIGPPMSADEWAALFIDNYRDTIRDEHRELVIRLAEGEL